MADIFTEINKRFHTGTLLVKFLFINVGVFISIKFLLVVMRLFMADASFVEHLEMPSSFPLFIRRPWTLITYMFVHFQFLHLLFNMLWLYWFGKIFLRFFTNRQLGGLYVLGGLAGGLLFLITYNTLPYLRQFADNSFLIGASASVMAIVFAVSFYEKDFVINLLFLGRIKLIYLAIGVLLLDILALSSDNAGGHIAHLGGSLFGILYARRYRRGKDLTAFINPLIDGFVNQTKWLTDFIKRFINRIKQKPTFTTHRATPPPRRPETDDAYRRRKNEENRVIDQILDKLKHSGYESLSAEEKRKLFDASKK